MNQKHKAKKIHKLMSLCFKLNNLKRTGFDTIFYHNSRNNLIKITVKYPKLEFPIAVGWLYLTEKKAEQIYKNIYKNLEFMLKKRKFPIMPFFLNSKVLMLAGEDLDNYPKLETSEITIEMLSDPVIHHIFKKQQKKGVPNDNK